MQGKWGLERATGREFCTEKKVNCRKIPITLKTPHERNRLLAGIDFRFSQMLSNEIWICWNHQRYHFGRAKATRMCPGNVAYKGFLIFIVLFCAYMQWSPVVDLDYVWINGHEHYGGASRPTKGTRWLRQQVLRFVPESHDGIGGRGNARCLFHEWAYPTLRPHSKHPTRAASCAIILANSGHTSLSERIV